VCAAAPAPLKRVGCYYFSTNDTYTHLRAQHIYEKAGAWVKRRHVRASVLRTESASGRMLGLGTPPALINCLFHNFGDHRTAIGARGHYLITAPRR